MPVKDKTYNGGLNHDAKTYENEWPGIDSRYRLIVVAALRSKQLQRGAMPRIVADPSKRRHTSIALEEVKQGLVPFTAADEDKQANVPGTAIESSVEH